MVVGDDHLEPVSLRLLDLGDGGDAAVDGENEAAALVGEAREGLAANAVALVEAARQVPRDVGAELAQEQDGERRRGDPVDVVVAVDADAPAVGDGCADALAGEGHVAEQERVVRRLLPFEEAARAVRVVVAAADEDGGGDVGDAERAHELGLGRVRAGSEDPGAVDHRPATLRGGPDGIGSPDRPVRTGVEELPERLHTAAGFGARSCAGPRVGGGSGR
ncbi:MAG: hypothetical protein JOZ56_01300 [Actinobacteria bacterium]|nr:hypothetical protein [Actinomycetota bacterium]